MSSIKKIVVVVDGDDHQSVLLKSEWLAKQTGAKLNLVKVVYDRFVGVKRVLGNENVEKIRNQLIAAQEAALSELVTGLKHRGIEAEKQVLWHPNPAEAICKCAKYGDVDLIVKAVRPHHRWGHLLTSVTEWNLIRHSAVPVLFVKDAHHYDARPVIVALDIGSEDEVHQELNRQLIHEAAQWQKLTGAPIHVVAAYPLPSMDVPAEFSVVNYEALREEIEQGYRQGVMSLLDKHPLEYAQIWVREGVVEDVLADVANQIQASLVLVGTVARTGVSAVVMGNTAERVIDAIDCDVMVLRHGALVELA